MDYATLILLGAALTTSLYALFLNRIHERYTPDWTWLTVVGGNALIGAWFALWLWIAPLVEADGTLAAFWRLLATNIAAGIPIIAWQTGQKNARAVTRRPRPRDDHDQSARRPAAD